MLAAASARPKGKRRLQAREERDLEASAPCGAQHLLRPFPCLHPMRTVEEHLRFYYRNDVIVLTKTCVACENKSVCTDEIVRGNTRTYRDHRTPLRKFRTRVAIFREPLRKSVETFRDLLPGKTRKIDQSLVYLYTGKDARFSTVFLERLPFFGRLPKCFIIKNDTRENSFRLRCRDQYFAIQAPILFGLFYVDQRKAFICTRGRFIRSKDSPPW